MPSDCSAPYFFQNINDATDINTILSSSMKVEDDDIIVLLTGDFEYKINFSLFNSKKIFLNLYNSAKGKFNFNNIQNANITIQSFNYKSNVHIEGSNLNDKQTSINFINLSLTSDINILEINSLSITNSSLCFSQLTLNSFYYKGLDNKELSLFDDYIQIDNQIKLIYYGNNQIFYLELTTNNDLTINNQSTKMSSISTFSFNTLKSLTFIGNDFIYSNILNLDNCLSIITSIPIIINAKMTISSDMIINISNNIKSRVPIQLNSIFIKNGSLQLKSSFIDLHIFNLNFSTKYYPIYPCVGLGGSSTIIAEKVGYIGNLTYFKYDSLNIMLDITGPQTDESLSLLMSQEWNAITFNSYPDEFKEVQQFSDIIYSPNNIYGFISSGNLIQVKSIKSENYIIKFNVLSYTDIPLLICYAKHGKCPDYYTRIYNESNIAESIPSKQKNVIFTIEDNFNIDFTGLTTTNCNFTISGYRCILSFNTSEYSKNPSIYHLYFEECEFGEVELNINAKIVTFHKCKVYTKMKSISFNQESTIYADAISTSIFNWIVSETPHIFADGVYIDYEVDILYIDSNTITFFPTPSRSGVFYIKNVRNIDINLPIVHKTDFKLQIVFKSKINIDRISFHFIPMTNSQLNTYIPKINISFLNLSSNININALEMDMGDFTNRVFIDLQGDQNIIKWYGKDIKFQNVKLKPDNNLCACNDFTCEKCLDDMIKVKFNDLSQMIEQKTNELIYITFITDKNDDLPILNLTTLNNNEVSIQGYDSDTAIKIDCSTEYFDDFYQISFDQIKLIPIEGSDLRISHLFLADNCVLDPLFNDIGLIVNSLVCNNFHIVYKTINIQGYLILNGNMDEISSSKTKISFKKNATFQYKFIHSMKIKGTNVKFNDIEFDITGVFTKFSLIPLLDEFLITGENASLNSHDIIFTINKPINIIRFDGTWNNESSSLFILNSGSNVDSTLALRSENVPIESSLYTIQIEKENVSIKSGIYYVKQINSTIDEITTLGADYITSNINFNSSRINLKINEFYSYKHTINMKIDLYDHNYIEIGKVGSPREFKYTVTCFIDCELNDSRLIDFMNEDYVLFRFLIEDYDISFSKYVTFDSNCPPGFNNDNFGLIQTDGRDKIIFHTYSNPLEAEIILRYVNNGDCKKANCHYPIISDANIKSGLSKFIYLNNTNVTLVFYTPLTSDLVLDFDNESINLNKLTLYPNNLKENPNITVPIILGSSVSNLNATNIHLNTLEYNLNLQNIVLRNSTLPNDINYSIISKLDVDDTTLVTLNINEFYNTFYIVVHKSEIILFTLNGIKVNGFEVDPDKLTNVRMVIDNPKTLLNVENNVTTIKTIKEFIFKYKDLYFGYNWDKIDSSTQNNYTNLLYPLNIIPNSFPIESWNFGKQYNVFFDKNLFPITQPFVINDQDITIESKKISSNPIYCIFDNVIIDGNSQFISNNRQNEIDKIINLTGKKDSSFNIQNMKIMNEFTLEPGSRMTCSYIDDNIATINLEWDLDKTPYFYVLENNYVYVNPDINII